MFGNYHSNAYPKQAIVLVYGAFYVEKDVHHHGNNMEVEFFNLNVVVFI